MNEKWENEQKDEQTTIRKKEQKNERKNKQTKEWMNKWTEEKNQWIKKGGKSKLMSKGEKA